MKWRHFGQLLIQAASTCWLSNNATSAHGPLCPNKDGNYRDLQIEPCPSVLPQIKYFLPTLHYYAWLLEHLQKWLKDFLVLKNAIWPHPPNTKEGKNLTSEGSKIDFFKTLFPRSCKRREILFQIFTFIFDMEKVLLQPAKKVRI